MKLLKIIGKVFIVYLIGSIFIFSLVIRVKQVNENDRKIMEDKNIKEYYVYENK